jgi:glutamate synthase (NADPH) large chain
MTGGTVVVLGGTGRNFAAGMSGGLAYVYDEQGDFATKCNMAMVELEPMLSSTEQQAQSATSYHRVVRGGAGETDEVILRTLIERHCHYTGSTRARELLNDWVNSRAKFIKVFPSEYKRALAEMEETKLEEIAA